MTATTLTVADFASAGKFWTRFEGINTDHVVIVKEDGTEIESCGLLSIANTWYINGPVRNEFTISTLTGPISATAGTTIRFQKPAGAKAFRRAASAFKRIWG
jgi:hypothetical protein